MVGGKSADSDLAFRKRGDGCNAGSAVPCSRAEQVRVVSQRKRMCGGACPVGRGVQVGLRQCARRVRGENPGLFVLDAVRQDVPDLCGVAAGRKVAYGLPAAMDRRRYRRYPAREIGDAGPYDRRPKAQLRPTFLDRLGRGTARAGGAGRSPGYPCTVRRAPGRCRADLARRTCGRARTGPWAEPTAAARFGLQTGRRRAYLSGAGPLRP